MNIKILQINVLFAYLALKTPDLKGILKSKLRDKTPVGR